MSNEGNDVEDVLVLDNTNLEGEELQRAIDAIVSRGLYAPEMAKKLLATPGSKVIRKEMKRADAQQLLGIMRMAGILCNSRPGKTTSGFTLVEKPPEYKECPC